MNAHRSLPALAIAGFLLLAGCSDKTASNGITQPESAQSGTTASGAVMQDYVGRALGIVPGTAVQTVTATDASDGASLVRVTVQPRKGAAVVVSFDANSGVLEGISGGALTNAYDVDPGPYFISVALAASLVQREAPGTVTGWSFARSAAANEWAYTLALKDSSGAKRLVVISAISKNILSNSAL
ncbi:MAG: hypothetical protein IPP94_06525 [Ignavibacteria bacterium]|nr:hypothetical protein [Ignavibacteria bacterium]